MLQVLPRITPRSRHVFPDPPGDSRLAIHREIHVYRGDRILVPDCEVGCPRHPAFNLPVAPPASGHTNAPLPIACSRMWYRGQSEAISSIADAMGHFNRNRLFRRRILAIATLLRQITRPTLHLQSKIEEYPGSPGRNHVIGLRGSWVSVDENSPNRSATVLSVTQSPGPAGLVPITPQYPRLRWYPDFRLMGS